MSLLRDVVTLLQDGGIEHALIGAAAMVTHLPVEGQSLWGRVRDGR